MGLTAKDGGGDYTPVPEGTHIARCCWVIDLGTQESQFGDKRQVLLGWELPNEKIESGDRAGEPLFISNFYTLSLHEKAKLREHLEAWRGKGFTEDELDGFDLRKVAGLPCQITVVHKKSGERTKARVSAVSALPKGMTDVPDQVNPTRIYDLDDPDLATFDLLPEWLQKIIDSSKERSRSHDRAADYDPNDEGYGTPDSESLSEIPF